METVLHLLATYGLGFVFLNLLAEQLGLPVPAYPVLVVMGAWSVDGRVGCAALLATAMAASAIADSVWYLAGRHWGQRVLRTVCRISISPDSCVRQTESLFVRWGVGSLLVAKFIPGFGTVASALAGRMRVPPALFAAAALAGALLYSGVAITLGRIFHAAVDDVVAAFESLGRIGLVVVAAALVLFIAAKWWQRWRLVKELRMSRITVHELEQLIDGGASPTILDVRSAQSRERDGSIPGAQAWALHDDEAAPELPRDTTVVVYCACPNEASAALVARRLQRAGFGRVRPLHGGIEAWIAAGLPVERPDAG
jgi:membrane protein DedA with SNARE-associated domain/rhodanese-related sulfurtransferase